MRGYWIEVVTAVILFGGFGVWGAQTFVTINPTTGLPVWAARFVVDSFAFGAGAFLVGVSLVNWRRYYLCGQEMPWRQSEY